MVRHRIALRAVSTLRGAIANLEGTRPPYVVAAFVVGQWLTTLALALSIRHTRWLYFHGGDQNWLYTTSRLLTKGSLPPTNVGYGWSVILLPFSLAGGPNLVSALPAIVLLNVLVLMPLAMAAMYGIGERLGGRLFGYWILALWIAVPVVGIAYTDTGFKQRYTEFTLPDGLGLTSLSDFPTMVAIAVAAFFCLRAVQQATWSDAALAGAFAGIAIGIQPSSSLFLGGAVLALAGCKRWRAMAVFGAGLAPFLVALTVWKWRGLGYVPLFHAAGSARTAGGAAFEPLGALNLHQYLNLHWSQLSSNLGSLQEHFWSARVVEWTLVAGTVALARRGLVPLLLFGGWFWALLLVRGTGDAGNLETGALLRMLMPAIPAFVVMLAALPLLLPRVPALLPRIWPRPLATDRGATTTLAAVIALFAVVPIALAGAATPTRKGIIMAASGPVPIDTGLHVHALVTGRRVALSWSSQHSDGAPFYYEVLRSPAGACSTTPSPAPFSCGKVIGLVRRPPYVDAPRVGKYDYWIMVGANWLDVAGVGNEYVAGTPASVTVP